MKIFKIIWVILALSLSGSAVIAWTQDVPFVAKLITVPMVGFVWWFWWNWDKTEET